MIRSLLAFGILAIFIACAFAGSDEVSASAAVSSVVSSASSSAPVTTLLESMRPSSFSLIRFFTDALSSVLPASDRRTSDVWKAFVASEADPALRDAYAAIEWAASKNDVRLCSSFDPSTLRRTGSPTAGDLLALCIAKATGEAARCRQIDPHATLRSVCETELEGGE